MRNFAIGIKRIVAMKHILLFFIPLSLLSCEILDNDPEKHVRDDDSTYIALDEVARLLSSLPIHTAQLAEVHDAVTSSSCNGYDEEYTMDNLFTNPGAGVGDETGTRSTEKYTNPLRDLIVEYVRSEHPTRSADSFSEDPDRFLEALQESDIQIYWPFSENWDGDRMPIITFDPENESSSNIGYKVISEADGSHCVEEITVDEDMAKETPVWVINRNSDSQYTSLELLRREDPDWGSGGGNVIVRPENNGLETRGNSSFRSLILKDFTMNRQYDSWFAGASEFFVKIGSVEDFTAVTEAELQLYNPLVTDFMIVVKRNQVGLPQPFNAVLVSEWTDQLTHCALMITEDDGGTRTEWKCSATVKINSKSYGFDLSIPFRTRDDIVWRGQLSDKWIEANNNLEGRFGDLNLTFEILEY